MNPPFPIDGRFFLIIRLLNNMLMIWYNKKNDKFMIIMMILIIIVVLIIIMKIMKIMIIMIIMIIIIPIYTGLDNVQ